MMTDRLRLAGAAFASIRGQSRIVELLLHGGREELASRVAELEDAVAERVNREAADLEQQGVSVMLLGEDRYPQRLARLPSPPPILYYRGNIGLLEEPAVGMCGSRDASPEGLEAARFAGVTVARSGLTVISGNARGVDTETHLAAIREGGNTIIVLAEGIEGFSLKRAMRDAGADWDRMLVLSQFPARQRWTVHGAMIRNAIIAGLGVALVVIEAGERGGTLDAGLKGIELRRPVLALDYQSGSPPGNTILFSKGAIRVASTGDLRRAIHDVEEAVETGQLELWEVLAQT
jgi:DNA processing protein